MVVTEPHKMRPPEAQVPVVPVSGARVPVVPPVNVSGPRIVQVPVVPAPAPEPVPEVIMRWHYLPLPLFPIMQTLGWLETAGLMRQLRNCARHCRTGRGCCQQHINNRNIYKALIPLLFLSTLQAVIIQPIQLVQPVLVPQTPAPIPVTSSAAAAAAAAGPSAASSATAGSAASGATTAGRN